ncbi:MAG: tyrosine--tRNA ligase [Candidatus Staskawiczbacteria bacterium RIFCSPLOWO2_01_FULL_33_9]|uniref:Tyrosine--tRNA ligase n=1 Tax=Candidatus Staskawiczbacteria bacterium RIFCSPLOWO2_01_FULL_33_9 TaxID=1802211 RepID=A0A1G2IA27_9BACT|nr:MAG: tyrosine--tRNA ligase [Candidatus Staskawiczbacteria bacterium RIFCSPLOWO2_01_FULL_33_9]
MINTNSEKINEILSRGVEDIFEKDSLEKKLKSGKQLRVKFGIDPTSPDLHLGHSIPLRKLKQFQDLGHKVVLLIGDFTATIGDPTGTGKGLTRSVLTEEQVKKNMKDYMKQISKILDIKEESTFETRYNTEWFGKMTMRDFYSLARIEYVSQLMARSMFRERREKEKLEKKDLLTLSEFTYPLLQAYDSVMVEADVEIGGLDQIFNMLNGRKIQEKLGQKPQDVIALKLLIGLDGVNKMSKSLGNQIVLDDSSSDIYGKIMSIPDNLIFEYLELLANISIEEVKKIPNPRDQKAVLAKEIVKIYHGKKEAQKAEDEFNKTFRDKEMPTDIPVFETDKKTYPILDLLFDSGLAESKNDAKRVIKGGGVELESDTVTDWRKEIEIEDDTTIRFGKRKFIKIKKK